MYCVYVGDTHVRLHNVHVLYSMCGVCMHEVLTCDVCVCAWGAGIYVYVYMCMGVVYDICFIYVY